MSRRISISCETNGLSEALDSNLEELSEALLELEKSGMFNITIVVQPNKDIDIRLIPQQHKLVEIFDIKVVDN